MSTSVPVAARRDAAFQAGLVAFVITLIGVVFNLLRLAAGLDEGSLAAALAAFVLLLIVGLGLSRHLGLGPRELGFNRPAPLPAIAGTAAAAVVLVGAAWITAPHLELPRPAQLMSGLLLFGAGTAPAEELLFRGALYGWLLDRTGPAAAVVITSLSFALAHVPVYGWSSFAVATAAGVLFGWLRWWSGSLWPAIGLHVLADLSILWL